MSEERRKYIRVNVQDIIECELFSIPAGSSVKKEFVSKNISAGGILFNSDTKYNIGDLLKLKINAIGWEKYLSEFYKPDELSKSKPIIALATVVRVELLDNDSYDIGVSLNAIDSSHQKALDKLVHAINSKHE